MIIENKQAKPWRRVAKPLPKYSTSGPKVVSKPPAPPVSPKPGSKVYLYVYDGDSENSQSQYHKNPHFTRQASLEHEVPYPYADDKKESQRASQRSGRERVRDQGRKSEKAYKVLAEVTPNLRSSSRGGRMFVKQKQRMEKYTKESQHSGENEPQVYGNSQDLTQGASDTWASPWNLASKSPTAVKYITTRRLAGPVTKTRRSLRDPLGFLPKPPDFWRAKVEQNFPPNGPSTAHRVRSTSVQGRYPNQNIFAENSSPFDRPDSAPPAESPTYYDSHHVDDAYNPHLIYDENQDYYSNSGMPPRPASAALPSATIHFDAKRYYAAPQRRQGLRRGWNVFTTTPHVQKDFNARAKGWHRNY